jgi:hypothetical protein
MISGERTGGTHVDTAHAEMESIERLNESLDDNDTVDTGAISDTGFFMLLRRGDGADDNEPQVHFPRLSDVPSGYQM